MTLTLKFNEPKPQQRQTQSFSQKQRQQQSTFNQQQIKNDFANFPKPQATTSNDNVFGNFVFGFNDSQQQQTKQQQQISNQFQQEFRPNPFGDFQQQNQPFFQQPPQQQQQQQVVEQSKSKPPPQANLLVFGDDLIPQQQPIVQQQHQQQLLFNQQQQQQIQQQQFQQQPLNANPINQPLQQNFQYVSAPLQQQKKFYHKIYWMLLMIQNQSYLNKMYSTTNNQILLRCRLMHQFNHKLQLHPSLNNNNLDKVCQININLNLPIKCPNTNIKIFRFQLLSYITSQMLQFKQIQKLNQAF